MPESDLPLEQLRAYRPTLIEPIGFDDFWAETITRARDAGGAVTREPATTPITQLRVEDLTFPGFDGEPIRAWLTMPLHATGPLPTVIEYLGYGGGRGLPGERMHWALAGYVHVLMDTRGQGSAWGSGGDTPDPHGADSAFPGFMTKGVLDPETYYYRRLFTDGVRLVDAVAELPEVDAARIAVTGGSQGGAISLAVAALHPSVAAVMADVPFLCDFERSISKTPDAPYTELTRYLGVHRDRTERVLATLRYFDGVHFAGRITASALVSVGLLDTITLPSTVFAAYNALTGADKEIVVYPYNGHEHGDLHQWVAKTAWLRERFSAAS